MIGTTVRVEPDAAAAFFLSDYLRYIGDQALDAKRPRLHVVLAP
jgi:hypothetical protein